MSSECAEKSVGNKFDGLVTNFLEARQAIKKFFSVKNTV